MIGIFGLILLPLVLLVALGWLAPLILGLVLHRRMLVVIGGAWALASIALVAGLVFLGSRAFSGGGVRPQNFDAATYAGPTGCLAMAHHGPFRLLLRQHDAERDGGRFFIEGEAGRALAPAGSLTVEWLELRAPGPATGAATVAYSLGTAADKLELQAGRQLDLPYGPPFTAVITTARRPGGMLELNLKLTDAANRSVTFSGGDRQTAPAFEAVAPSGDIFWRGSFEYG
jgi:hypothetical protein